MKFGGLRPFAYETGASLEPVNRFVCGVPNCADGIAIQDELDTVVECETHNARTTYDTTPREVKEQQIIRVQDDWRQHGITRGK